MLIDFTVILAALLIGSFLNVVIYRLPQGESIVWPGSHCAACGHQLQPIDLVPVFSYLGLRGRCRYCREKISRRYPLVELLTAVAFLLVFQKGGLSIWTADGLVLTAILIVAAFTDIDVGIIPDRLTYPAILLGLAASHYTVGILPALAGAAAFGGGFLLIAIITRGGMGGGDIKLAAVIGAFTGLKGALLAFILSSILGGLWAAGLVAAGYADRKSIIRFGPFLSVGGWLSYIYGNGIFMLYMSIFT